MAMNDNTESQNEDSSATTIRCSVQEAARLLDISESSVRNRIKKGILVAERDGKRWKVLLPRILLQPQEQVREVGGGTDELALPWQANEKRNSPAASSFADLAGHTDLSPPVEESRGPLANQSGDHIAADHVAPGMPIPAEWTTPNPQPAQFNSYVEEVERVSEGTDDLRDTSWATVREDAPSQPLPNLIGGQAQRVRWTDLLTALVLGIGILAITDYLWSGDPIPLLGEPDRTAHTLPSVGPTPENGGLAQAPRASPTDNAPASIALATTTTPTPSSTPELPTVLPSATAIPPTPTIAPPAEDQVLQKVAAAKSSLRTGELEATIAYSEGQRSVSYVRFDLGNETGVHRVHMTTTYHGTDSVQTMEYIMIGENAWQRQADGQWTAVGLREGVWGQVQAFLPQTEHGVAASLAPGGNQTEVHWDDPARAADVVLEVDPATGTPRTMRQTTRATGAVLTVTYNAWNTPVEINAPGS